MTIQAAAPARPQHPESSVRLLVSQTLVQTKRILTRWGRDRVTVMEALVLPVLFMFVLYIVLGRLIYAITHDSALMREQSSGLLTRLWVMPVHRASGPLSRIIAEAVRIVVTTAVMLGAGVLLGFRFREGAMAAVMWMGVPVIFGMAFAALTTTVALYTSKTLVVEAVELWQLMLIFFSTGLLPLNQYPHWVQPVVAHQPVSYAIAAMRGLSAGGPVLAPMIATLLWSAGIAAACVVPMAIGYRRASTH
jgi:ABC-2 type transport system permease protein